MQNSAYWQESIISVSITILNIKRLSSKLMFNNLAKLTKILSNFTKKSM